MTRVRNTATLFSTAALVASLAAPAFAGEAKNVILMISDGQGFNTVKATEYFTGGKAVYEGSDFIKLGMQNNSANNPAGYDPAAMAADFNYHLGGATDSASAASAMYAGQKIYDGQINITTDGKPMQTFFEKAAKAGRSIGAVSSVEITHATPAAVYGHNNSRNNYEDLGKEGITGSNPLADNAFYDALNYYNNLKVLMGAGHPDYDKNGNYNPAVTDRYVGGATTWIDALGGSNGWSVAQDKADFQSLATGATPDKVLGVAKVNTTLQYDRTAGAPMIATVPTLTEMTRAALNVLDNDTDGFAVMIEGGAVDWAGHGNNLERMIEEQIDFNNSVQAVVDWVNLYSNWDETLLIVTADHETGSLWGPGAFDYVDNNTNGVYNSGVDTFLGYKHITDAGAGNVPGHSWSSGGHTNQIVPLYVKGAGSDLLQNYIYGTDTNLAAMYGLDSQEWSGDYIDNTSIYSLMMDASSVPEPASLALLALGGAALIARRRSA